MQDGRKSVWSIPKVFVAFLSRLKQNIVLPYVQIAFLKFHSCDNRALVECISIAAVAVHLNVKLEKLVSHLIRWIAIFKSLPQS